MNSPAENNYAYLSQHETFYNLSSYDIYFKTLLEAEKYFNEDVTRVANESLNVTIALVNNSFQDTFSKLYSYGVNKKLTKFIFRLIVTYTLKNENKALGDISEKTLNIFSSLKKSIPWIFTVLKGYKVPEILIDDTIKSVIKFCLVKSNRESISTFLDDWGPWEDLGGSLTSAPSVTSWGRNRLDVFARGIKNTLIHKWWDGSHWTEWEDLGGELSSGPCASSRASNRIDVFARDKDGSLIFIFWNGVNWSDWKNLEGVLISNPSSVSWGPERIDVFAMGDHQNLIHIIRE